MFIYAGHDLEDLVYLFNYTTTLDNQVLASYEEVRAYIKECLFKLLKDGRIVSAMEGHLYYEQASVRMEIIKERMQNILADS
jgi:hypothetical protein